jgi:hypothetical protein
MNLPESYTFGDTLDAIFLSLLENLKEIHDYNIVHRDRERFFFFFIIRGTLLSNDHFICFYCFQ